MQTLAVFGPVMLRTNRPAAHFYWRLSRFFPGLVDWLTREGWRRRGRPKIPADRETTSIGANNAAPSRDRGPQHREEMQV